MRVLVGSSVGAVAVPSRTLPHTTSVTRTQGHEEIVWAVEVHGRRLFSASADRTIRVWDIPSRR